MSGTFLSPAGSAAASEMRGYLGDVVESDNEEEVTAAIERHRSTLSQQDRRKSMHLSTKSRELEQLRLTTSKLMEELEAVRAQHAEDLKLRVACEASFHELRLEMIRKKHELDAAVQSNSALQRRVEELETEKQQLTELLEARISTSRKRAVAVKALVVECEERERSVIDWALGFAAAAQAAALIPAVPAATRDFEREVILLTTLERLQRMDIAQDHTKALQTLLNRWAHIRSIKPSHAYSTPLREATPSPSPSQRAKSPSSGHRPWYPPGSARIPPATPVVVRRSRSPSSKAETPRQQLPTTLSNMQQLLANLSNWSEGHH